MTKWEYRFTQVDLGPKGWQSGFQVDRIQDELAPELNQFGVEGWEAVGTTQVGLRLAVLMKRPLS